MNFQLKQKHCYIPNYIKNDFFKNFLTFSCFFFFVFFADKECFDPTKNGIDTSTIRNTLLVKPILVLTTSYPVDKNEKHNDVFIGVM